MDPKSLRQLHREQILEPSNISNIMERCPKCGTRGAFRLVAVENDQNIMLLTKKVCLECDETWLDPL